MPPKKEPLKRGRSKGSVGWLPQEMTALGMAAIEASEKPDQKGAQLESGTAKHYPGALRLVCEEEGGWVGPPAQNYTMEDSMRHRTQGGGLWNRWNSAAFKGFIVNTIGPVYDKVLPCPHVMSRK
jgi:hypothetical protein